MAEIKTLVEIPNDELLDTAIGICECEVENGNEIMGTIQKWLVELKVLRSHDNILDMLGGIKETCNRITCENCIYSNGRKDMNDTRCALYGEPHEWALKKIEENCDRIVEEVKERHANN